VRLQEFRKLIKAEFGSDLQHATPANVREFIDTVQDVTLPNEIGRRIVLDESFNSYEEIIKDFFAKMLELPPEEAMVALYLLALELAFSGIESQYADRFARLFPDVD